MNELAFLCALYEGELRKNQRKGAEEIIHAFMKREFN